MSKTHKKYIAEAIGTAVLVLFGCGTAVVTAGQGDHLVATALAFGLAIVATAYVIGDISGCHVNPAVSFAMLLTGKMGKREFLGYVISQVLGALAGTALLSLILLSVGQTGGWEGIVNGAGLGANGFDASDAGGINVWGAILTEIILTFVFIYTILGVTSDSKKASVAGIVIGLTLTFVHIIGINLTGTSVNPARSLAPAIFLGGTALGQVWVFILAPFIGSALAAYTFKALNVAKK
ncbi:aquaporin [Candidatus Saccharibacteria bacterium]|nr:aquaporin [Candidatus Saccharibacteria bacterium]